MWTVRTVRPLCVLQVINKEGNSGTTLRNYDRPNERKFRKPDGYKFPRGTAKVLSQTFTPLSSLVTVTTEERPAAMVEG